MGLDTTGVGRYTCVECIGRGSYGDVFKGLDTVTGDQVAIKVIDLEEVEDDIESIHKEITMLAGCQCKNITDYYAAALQPGTTELMIVMELMACSVADLLAHGPLDEECISHILHEVLGSLVYLHGEHRIHRDVKAANILLNAAGAVKISDFGVSGQLSGTMGFRRRTFVGTPFWMAPEVIESTDEGYSEGADIWSLGITAIEMAMCAPPHADLHPMRVLFLIPKSDPPRLKGDFSPEFKDFVASCLQRDPSVRPSAKELLQHPFVAQAETAPDMLGGMAGELARRRQPLKSRRDMAEDWAAVTGTLPGWDFGTRKAAGRMTIRSGMGNTMQPSLAERFTQGSKAEAAQPTISHAPPELLTDDQAAAGNEHAESRTLAAHPVETDSYISTLSSKQALMHGDSAQSGLHGTIKARNTPAESVSVQSEVTHAYAHHSSSPSQQPGTVTAMPEQADTSAAAPETVQEAEPEPSTGSSGSYHEGHQHHPAVPGTSMHTWSGPNPWPEHVHGRQVAQTLGPAARHVPHNQPGTSFQASATTHATTRLVFNHADKYGTVESKATSRGASSTLSLAEALAAQHEHALASMSGTLPAQAAPAASALLSAPTRSASANGTLSAAVSTPNSSTVTKQQQSRLYGSIRSTEAADVSSPTDPEHHQPSDAQQTAGADTIDPQPMLHMSYSALTDTSTDIVTPSQAVEARAEPAAARTTMTDNPLHMSTAATQTTGFLSPVKPTLLAMSSCQSVGIQADMPQHPTAAAKSAPGVHVDLPPSVHASIEAASTLPLSKVLPGATAVESAAVLGAVLIPALECASKAAAAGQTGYAGGCVPTPAVTASLQQLTSSLCTQMQHAEKQAPGMAARMLHEVLIHLAASTHPALQPQRLACKSLLAPLTEPHSLQASTVMSCSASSGAPASAAGGKPWFSSSMGIASQVGSAEFGSKVGMGQPAGDSALTDYARLPQRQVAGLGSLGEFLLGRWQMEVAQESALLARRPM